MKKPIIIHVYEAIMGKDSWFLLGMIFGWLIASLIRIKTLPTKIYFDRKVLQELLKAEKLRLENEKDDKNS